MIEGILITYVFGFWDIRIGLFVSILEGIILAKEQKNVKPNYDYFPVVFND